MRKQGTSGSRTPAVSRHQWPERRRSGGYWRSPASPCWVAGDRRGCPAFSRTDRHHPRLHRPVGRGRRRRPRRQTQGTIRSAPRPRYDRPAACDPPGRGGRCWDTARTASPPATACYRRPPPCTPGHADPPPAQDGAPPDHPAPVRPVPGTRRRPPGRCVGASTGERLTPTTPLSGPAAATPAPYADGCSRPTHPCVRASRSGRGAARPPPGASPAVGRGTGEGSGADNGDTGRVAWGGHAWFAFSPGHARQQGCAQQPNARRQLLLEA